jgi:hypothetical protein
MLNTLNDEQILGIAECRDKWIKVGLQTGPVDREAAVVAVNKAYKCAGLQPPKEVVFCTSPIDMDEKIRAASNNEHKFISSYGFANCWSGWAAFVDYFATYTDVQNLEIFEGLRDLSYNCGFVSFFDTTCFISERPEYIKMDDTGRTHCENGPAIRYADGFEVYIWHGVRIPKSWITEGPDIDQALHNSNLELRRVASEIIGWAKILDHYRAVTIDEDADPQIGTLLKVNIPEVGEERFLKVLCGTGRTFAIPVLLRTMKGERSTLLLAANAWTYGIKPWEYKPGDQDVTKRRGG